MINLPNMQQPIEESGFLKPEWNTFFQQIKSKIKIDFSVDIGIPNTLETIINKEGNINKIWYSFFEKSYSSIGVNFGIPSAQEKLGKEWNNFFQNMYQNLK